MVALRAEIRMGALRTEIGRSGWVRISYRLGAFGLICALSVELLAAQNDGSAGIPDG